MMTTSPGRRLTELRRPGLVLVVDPSGGGAPNRRFGRAERPQGEDPLRSNDKDRPDGGRPHPAHCTARRSSKAGEARSPPRIEFNQ